jgi:hypothetical protein
VRFPLAPFPLHTACGIPDLPPGPVLHGIQSAGAVSDLFGPYCTTGCSISYTRIRSSTSYANSSMRTSSATWRTETQPALRSHSNYARYADARLAPRFPYTYPYPALATPISAGGRVPSRVSQIGACTARFWYASGDAGRCGRVRPARHARRWRRLVQQFGHARRRADASPMTSRDRTCSRSGNPKPPLVGC